GINININIDCEQLFRILPCKIKCPFIIIGKVETVFKFGTCVCGISKQPYAGVHHLRVISTCLLSDNKLFQTRKRAEGVNDYLSDLTVTTQEQLSLGDISGIIGDSVSDITTRQCGYSNNCY